MVVYSVPTLTIFLTKSTMIHSSAKSSIMSAKCRVLYRIKMAWVHPRLWYHHRRRATDTLPRPSIRYDRIQVLESINRPILYNTNRQVPLDATAADIGR